ncbi:hypothetical protein RJ639_011577, partial [Escallonia herrerae]
MRKLCVVELFTVKRVKLFSRVRDEEVTGLINSLSQVSNSPVQVNEKDGQHFDNEKFQHIMDEAMAVLSSFWGADFFPYFGWILDVFSGLHGRLEMSFQEFDVLEEHLDPTRPQEHEDVTDILVGLAKDQTASLRLSKDHVKAILMSPSLIIYVHMHTVKSFLTTLGKKKRKKHVCMLPDIFVGAIDTCSITMVWAMTELARNPRVMKKVQAEIRSSIGKKPKVDEAEVEKLKYLKMVVKETFRLHPPATLLLPRETRGHCKIGRYDIYPKTRILVNAWAIGRDPKVWKNPDNFYPERFAETEIDFRGQHFELLPFGAGRRICPGLMMGATAVEFALANLLHCFDWEFPCGMKREDISVEAEFGLTVHKKFPLFLVP